MNPPPPAAGFWPRWLAWSIDALLLLPPTLLLAWLPLRDPLAAVPAAFDRVLATLDRSLHAALAAGGPELPFLGLMVQLADEPALREAALALNAGLLQLAGILLLAWLALAAPWWIGFEILRAATPGKRALGLRVVGADGGRLRLRRAGLRFLAGGLSWLTLNLGHAMAALPPTHRALHDRIAGTGVVHRDAARTGMPAWGWPLVGLQACALVLAVAWLAALPG